MDRVMEEKWELFQESLSVDSSTTGSPCNLDSFSDLRKFKWQILQEASISTVRTFMRVCYPKRCVTDYDIMVRLISDCTRSYSSRSNCKARVDVLHRVVKLLADEDPKLCTVKDLSQFSLLHHTCLKRPHDTDLIKWLVNSNPSSVSMKDKVGRTPIHLFCSVFNFDECCFEKCMDTVLALTRSNPQILRSRCLSGRTPLHVYLDREVIVDYRVVRVLCSSTIHNDTIYSKIQYHLLPVEHYLFKSQYIGYVDERVVKVLLEEDLKLKCDMNRAGVVHAVLRLDGKHELLLDFVLSHFQSDVMIYYDGQLPLHYILKSNENINSVWFESYFRPILDAYPNAVTMIDRSNSMYPFLMATLVFSSINICYELLTTNPSIVYTSGNAI